MCIWAEGKREKLMCDLGCELAHILYTKKACIPVSAHIATASESCKIKLVCVFINTMFYFVHY